MRRNSMFDRGRGFRVDDNQVQDLRLNAGSGAAIGEYAHPESSEYSDSYYGPGRENRRPPSRPGDQVRGVVGDFRPDVINHHAAQIAVPVSVHNPVEDARRNIMGSLAVFDAARKYDVGKLINVSSGGAIYGEPETLPCGESR